MRVGFVGLGDIGRPMAFRLHEAGHTLTVWNRTSSRADSFADLGVTVARSPADLAASCDIVCLCVLSATAVEDVLFGGDGIASASRPPRLIVDHSTISPDETLAFAGRLQAHTGTAWLDAPVSGGPVGARAGALAIMAGGTPEDFALAQPVLESLAARLTLVGELGTGQLAKACNQIIGFITTAAIAEAFAVAKSAGLAATALSEALAGGFGDSNILNEYRRASRTGEPGGLKGLIDAYVDLSGGYIRPDYVRKIDILHKDIAIGNAIARRSGIPIPLLNQVETLGRLLNYQRSRPAGAND